MLNFVAQLLIVLQKQACIVAPLRHAHIPIGIPSPSLVDDFVVYGHIQHRSLMRDAFAVNNVKFSGFKRRSNFIFYNLNPRPVADDVVAVFDGINPAHVKPNGSIEFKRFTACGGFRIAEHYANFFAELVDKDDDRVGFADDTRKFAQRLGHKTRLQADMRIPHIALNFRLWHQCCYRVDNNNIHRPAAHQRLTDFKRLFSSIRL